jgi:hypothetical protein
MFAAVFWWFRGTDPDITPVGRGKINVYIYNNAFPVKQGVLPPGSTGANAIRALLERKRGDWWWTIFFYSPDELHFNNMDFSLDVQHKLLILTSNSYFVYHNSYVTALNGVEYDNIKSIVLGNLQEEREWDGSVGH